MIDINRHFVKGKERKENILDRGYSLDALLRELCEASGVSYSGDILD